MIAALHEAQLASEHGEVPVGAIVAHNGKIIGRGRNQTEQTQAVVHHAEILAIREASQTLQNWRLPECILCVTLEPCTMCLGALRLARIPILVFGAGDSKQGAVGSLYDLSQDPRTGKPLRVIQGIKKRECESMLRNFFETLRE